MVFVLGELLKKVHSRKGLGLCLGAFMFPSGVPILHLGKENPGSRSQILFWK